MDEAVQRFRQQARRELGARQGAERRYSVGLRQQAVAYWQAREPDGFGLEAVATALGIAPVSLRRWAQDPRFRPVRVIGKSSPCPVVTRTAEAERRMGYAVTAAGSVTVPGTARAASVAVSRYVCGSMPTSFADSHSV